MVQLLTPLGTQCKFWLRILSVHSFIDPQILPEHPMCQTLCSELDGRNALHGSVSTGTRTFLFPPNMHFLTPLLRACTRHGASGVKRAHSRLLFWSLGSG